MIARDLEDVDLHDLQAATDVLQGRWKTTILFHLARAPMRFAALRRAVGGISEKVLTEQLRELESDGIISRNVENTAPPKVEYAMTEHGLTLCDLVRAMATWGRTHREATLGRTSG